MSSHTAVSKPGQAVPRSEKNASSNGRTRLPAARHPVPPLSSLPKLNDPPKQTEKLAQIPNEKKEKPINVLRSLAFRVSAAKRRSGNGLLDRSQQQELSPQTIDVSEQKPSRSISRNLGKGYGIFLNPWVKESMVGRGQFGVVYTATDLRTSQTIAVKQVIIQSIEMVNSMKEEVILMCRASFRNPNVVECMGWSVSDDVDTDRGSQVISDTGNGLSQIQTMNENVNLEQFVGKHFNIFMEYISRGSIACLLKQSGPLNEVVTRNYMRQLLLGLRSLHAAGIAHRDIKCQNLLLTEDNTVKVADFGCAKWVDAASKVEIQGSIPWLPPEVIKQEVGKEGDETSILKGWKKADVWAVGCTFIEMMTGRPPWKNFSNPAAAMYNIAMCKEPLQLPTGVVHEDGQDFLRCCCTLNPEERPQVANLMYHKYVKVDTKSSERLNIHGQYVG